MLSLSQSSSKPNGNYNAKDSLDISELNESLNKQQSKATKQSTSNSVNLENKPLKAKNFQSKQQINNPF